MDAQLFAALLQQLIARGEISEDEATLILAMFLAGEISEADLPAPPTVALGAPTIEEPERDRAYLLLLLLLGYNIVPPGRLPEYQRREAHERLRAQYEASAVQYAAGAGPGKIRQWHEDMIAAVRAHLVRQATAGAGTRLDGRMAIPVEEEGQRQMAWLYYFAGALAVSHLLGRSKSEKYVAWRARLYAGAGWGAYYRTQEEAGDNDDGWVIYYDAVDDGRTCGPCRRAQEGSPYLPGTGPMPGVICEGGGACRCSRRAEYEPETYRRLVTVQG